MFELSPLSKSARSAITELGERRHKNKQAAEILKAAKIIASRRQERETGLFP